MPRLAAKTRAQSAHSGRKTWAAIARVIAFSFVTRLTIYTSAGQDFAYMLENCPMTCDICTEAEEHWNKLEEERKKSPTYEPDDSKVFTLTAETIDEFVEAYPLSLIMFYAPWCGHCQETAPRYREAANLLDQMATDGSMPQEVKLAKFDDSDVSSIYFRPKTCQPVLTRIYPNNSHRIETTELALKKCGISLPIRVCTLFKTKKWTGTTVLAMRLKSLCTTWLK